MFKWLKVILTEYSVQEISIDISEPVASTMMIFHQKDYPVQREGQRPVTFVILMARRNQLTKVMWRQWKCMIKMVNL